MILIFGLIGGANLSHEEYLEAYWLDWVLYPPLKIGHCTARTLLLYLHSFQRPRDSCWVFHMCSTKSWLENNSGIHQQTCNSEQNFIWKHAYCSKMLVAQKKRKNKGRIGPKKEIWKESSWGPGDHSFGVFFAVRAVRHPHIVTLWAWTWLTLKIAWGSWTLMWCGYQNHHRAWEAGNGLACLWEDSVINCSLRQVPLRITLPTGFLVSKVLYGGDIGGSLLWWVGGAPETSYHCFKIIFFIISMLPQC